jgi:hypothetical protein
MLVFYTWAVRLLADTVSLFAATEDIGWLAEETPQEGAALIAGGGSDGKDGGSDSLKWPTNGVLPIIIFA